MLRRMFSVGGWPVASHAPTRLPSPAAQMGVLSVVPALRGMGVGSAGDVLSRSATRFVYV